MSDRDYISEIINVRERRDSGARGYALFGRLRCLGDAFNNIDSESEHRELLRYFPIALVATLEGTFKEMLTKIIDSDLKYLNNSESILRNKRIDFKFLYALQGKKVSAGEFIAHSVSISQIEEINGLMSSVLGVNFFKEISTFKSTHSVIGWLDEKPEPEFDFNFTYKYINRAFYLRHIFCHEVAVAVDYNYDEIRNCMIAGFQFLDASFEFITQVIDPELFFNQSQLNKKSAILLDEIMLKIKAAKEELCGILEEEPERIFLLTESHNAWADHVEKFSRFCANKYEGGSISHFLYNKTAESLSKYYLATLHSQIEDEQTP